VARAVHWLPAVARRALAWGYTLRKSVAVQRKLADMLAGDASLLSLYFQRRRVMSDDQLAALGLDAAALGLTADWMPPESVAGLQIDDNDPVQAISQLESRFYQGNMLLRDADANSMAHGLEVRVPLLDQRLLNLVHRLTGRARLPAGAPAKFLLREAFGSLLGEEVARHAKHGFVLPIWNWMLGPLREVCEGSLTSLKNAGILRPEGIDRVWKAFLAEPPTPIWTRAFSLCVLGAFLRKTCLSR
jgi:asparagine synthase (glutamine-hydrolysing)